MGTPILKISAPSFPRLRNYELQCLVPVEAGIQLIGHPVARALQSVLQASRILRRAVYKRPFHVEDKA
jgi:hypothetical protein